MCYASRWVVRVAVRDGCAWRGGQGLYTADAWRITMGGAGKPLGSTKQRRHPSRRVKNQSPSGLFCDKRSWSGSGVIGAPPQSGYPWLAVPLTFGSPFVVLLGQADRQYHELSCDDRTCLGEEESEPLLGLIGFRRRRGYPRGSSIKKPGTLRRSPWAHRRLTYWARFSSLPAACRAEN
jgi:hypothetical protein